MKSAAKICERTFFGTEQQKNHQQILSGTACAYFLARLDLIQYRYTESKMKKGDPRMVLERGRTNQEKRIQFATIEENMVIEVYSGKRQQANVIASSGFSKVKNTKDVWRITSAPAPIPVSMFSSYINTRGISIMRRI